MGDVNSVGVSAGIEGIGMYGRDEFDAGSSGMVDVYLVQYRRKPPGRLCILVMLNQWYSIKPM